MENTLTNLDSAFEWMVLLLGILTTVLLQFLTFIPFLGNDLLAKTKLISSFVFPLVFSAIVWLFKKVVSNYGLKMFLCLVAWSSSTMTFVYYIIMLLIFIVQSRQNIWFQNPVYIGTVLGYSMLFGYVLMAELLYKRVTRSYRKLTHSLEFWKNPWSESGPPLVGAVTTVILAFGSWILV